MSGLYIHIPYCRSKCIYCDFYSEARTPQWDALTDALLREFSRRLDSVPGAFETLYLGGGTPSLYPPDELRRLLTGLRERAGNRFQPVETTIEVNPDDVDREHVEAWKSLGFNRVSMGLQSADDDELHCIRRRHDARSGLMALELLMSNFENVSVDLMFGLPGQTLASWERSVEEVVRLRPAHISAYALTVEEDTPIARMIEAGSLSATEEDVYLSMYQSLVSRLEAARYEHYEISNYALPGRRSRHNSSYWQGTPYLGLGPSAHSYDGRRQRLSNAPDVEAYLAGNCGQISEWLTEAELAEEYLLTRLRTAEGISLSELSEYVDSATLQRIAGRLSGEVKRGLLRALPADRFALSAEGMMLSDTVLVDLSSEIDRDMKK